MKIYNQKMIEIDKLKPYDKNARTHSSEQIAQIMQSIKEFGFTNPLLIDSDFNLIAGHGRLEAIKGLNKVDFKDKPILQVPCVICEGLSEVQKKALILADNKIALNAGWDEDILARELKELDECGFDLDLIGFSEIEIDEILEEPQEPQEPQEPTLKNIQYTISRQTQPSLNELLDLTLYNQKIKEIENLQVSNEFKEFLRYRATSFIEFKFDMIAEYYAHANKNEQDALEKMLCVIIDVKDALQRGILKIKDEVENFKEGGKYV